MEEKISPSKIGLRYGIFVGLALIIYGLILQLSGLYVYQGLQWLSYVILIVLIFMAHNTFKAANEGYIKYGQGLSIGVIMSIVGGAISGIFSFIYLKYVDDSALKYAIEKAEDDLYSRGMSDEQIEQALAMTEKFTSPMMILIFGILGMAFIGLLISLIVSAITKKDQLKAV